MGSGSTSTSTRFATSSHPIRQGVLVPGDLALRTHPAAGSRSSFGAAFQRLDIYQVSKELARMVHVGDFVLEKNEAPRDSRALLAPMRGPSCVRRRSLSRDRGLLWRMRRRSSERSRSIGLDRRRSCRRDRFVAPMRRRSCVRSRVLRLRGRRSCMRARLLWLKDRRSRGGFRGLRPRRPPP